MSIRLYLWIGLALFDAVLWAVIIKTVYGLSQLCPCIASIGG